MASQIPPLPPMNGTLLKLYNLANEPIEELKKPAKLAEAIRELALVNIYIYTETVGMISKVDSILKMVEAISNRQHNQRKEDIESAKGAAEKAAEKAAEAAKAVKDHKDSFIGFVEWFRDKILPTLVIGFILLLSQMLVWFYMKGNP